jgi:hypothetical protein
MALRPPLHRQYEAGSHGNRRKPQQARLVSIQPPGLWSEGAALSRVGPSGRAAFVGITTADRHGRSYLDYGFDIALSSLAHVSDTSLLLAPEGCGGLPRLAPGDEALRLAPAVLTGSSRAPSPHLACTVAAISGTFIGTGSTATARGRTSPGSPEVGKGRLGQHRSDDHRLGQACNWYYGSSVPTGRGATGAY